MFVSVSVESCKTIVPLALGNLIVLSAVGSTVVKSVSKPSAVAPSNLNEFCISIVVESTVVVEPCTVKLPAIVILLLPSAVRPVIRPLSALTKSILSVEALYFKIKPSDFVDTLTSSISSN